MKKIIFMILLSAITSLSGAQNNSAKGNQSPDEQALEEATRMETKLGLSAEQKTKWEIAAKERITANKPLKEKLNGSTTPQERKELQKQMKNNKDIFASKVTGFLNPEQKKKFDQELEQRKSRRPHRKPPGNDK